MTFYIKIIKNYINHIVRRDMRLLLERRGFRLFFDIFLLERLLRRRPPETFAPDATILISCCDIAVGSFAIRAVAPAVSPEKGAGERDIIKYIEIIYRWLTSRAEEPPRVHPFIATSSTENAGFVICERKSSLIG